MNQFINVQQSILGRLSSPVSTCFLSRIGWESNLRIMVNALGSRRTRVNAANYASAIGLSHITEQTLIDAADYVDQVAKMPCVPGQHVISKTILKQFGKRGVAQYIDLRIGAYDYSRKIMLKPISPSAAGKIDNFIKIDSSTTEALWQRVENDFNLALKRACANPTSLSADTLKTFLDILALHLIRSPGIQEQEATIVDAIRPKARSEFEKELGCRITDAQWEEFSRGFGKMKNSGFLFRCRAEYLFGAARQLLSNWTLTFLSFPTSEVLCISDRPLISIMFDVTTNQIVQTNKALDDVSGLVMPIHPNSAIFASNPKHPLSVAPSANDIIKLEIMSGKEWLYFPLHAEANLAPIIASLRP